jgi:ABC-type phosphonate transport system ATPase subunit
MTDSDVPPVVRVEHLTKFYGARRAVSDVSFDMQPAK